MKLRGYVIQLNSRFLSINKYGKFQMFLLNTFRFISKIKQLVLILSDCENGLKAILCINLSKV